MLFSISLMSVLYKFSDSKCSVGLAPLCSKISMKRVMQSGHGTLLNHMCAGVGMGSVPVLLYTCWRVLYMLISDLSLKLIIWPSLVITNISSPPDVMEDLANTSSWSISNCPNFEVGKFEASSGVCKQ